VQVNLAVYDTRSVLRSMSFGIVWTGRAAILWEEPSSLRVSSPVRRIRETALQVSDPRTSAPPVTGSYEKLVTRPGSTK